MLWPGFSLEDQIVLHENVLPDLVTFVQFKKREKTHGGVLLLVKLQDFSL